MKRDLTGLSDRTALAVVIDDIDFAIAGMLRHHAEFIRDHGGTDEEVEAELQIRRAELAQWREERITDVAAEMGLVREVQTIH